MSTQRDTNANHARVVLHEKSHAFNALHDALIARRFVVVHESTQCVRDYNFYDTQYVRACDDDTRDERYCVIHNYDGIACVYEMHETKTIDDIDIDRVRDTHQYSQTLIRALRTIAQCEKSHVVYTLYENDYIRDIYAHEYVNVTINARRMTMRVCDARTLFATHVCLSRVSHHIENDALCDALSHA